MNIKTKTIILIFILLFILTSCVRNEDTEGTMVSENSDNSIYSSDESNDYDYGNFNSQHYALLRLYAFDNDIFYLSNDGFYKTNNNKESLKLTNLLLGDMCKKGDWFYGVAYNITMQIDSEEPDNGLYLFSLDGKTSEKIIDQRAGVQYSEKYIFYATYENELTITRCDYNGENKKDIYSGEWMYWIVLNDSIIYVKSEDEDSYTDKIEAIDHDGNNPVVIATIPKIEKKCLSIYAINQDIYYRELIIGEYMPIETKLYKVKGTAAPELIISAEGVYRYIFTKDKIIANNTDQISTYSYDGTDENVIFTSSEDAISSLYYYNKNLYFCLDNNEKNIGSIKKLSLDTQQVTEIVKDIPLDGLVDEIIGDGYLNLF